MRFLFSISVCCLLAGAGAASALDAQPGSGPGVSQPGPGPERKANPLSKEMAKNEISIEVKEGVRHIVCNGIPDHPTGQFPGRGNPNTISAQKYDFRMPEKPTAAEQPIGIGSTAGAGGPPTLVGVALNGVVFDPGTAEWWHNDRSSGWNYEALSGKIDLGADSSHAHVQPDGAYHYHGIPTGLVERLQSARDQKTPAMVQVGWAADGYPIYSQLGYEKARDAKSALKPLKSSYRVKSGERPSDKGAPGGTYDGTFVQDFEFVAGLGDLDECNGRTGVTPEFPSGTYYYVLTDSYPFIPRFFHGTPDASFKHHGGPPGGRGGPGGPGGPGGRRGPGGRGGSGGGPGGGGPNSRP
jgi:hypothetical protein